MREGDTTTRAKAAYNLGVLFYEGSNYEGAWKSFREALMAAPGDPDALWNLELAWRAWQKESSSPLGSPAPAAMGRSAGSTEILKLFRRLETGSWRPGLGEDSQEDSRDW